ncbi:MAG: NADH-quinone oxidoreductase subunit NuoB [Thermoplasmata archaeon]|nr:MAG: NADH-quinone oxidoreductase subunit NuoB [Thermoplasmata archaeon]
MIPKAFKRSLWVFHVNSGSCNGCDIEIIAALTPRYDAERFGIKLVGSPRHADVIAFTGPVTNDMKDKVIRIIEQTPDPKVIVVVGSCGIGGGVFHESYHLAGPIDKLYHAKYFYVPGCPPRPEAIIQAFAKAWEWLEELEVKK